MNLILTSSPEKEGLTATTAKVFENALNDKTEVICLNHINLKKCTACGLAVGAPVIKMVFVGTTKSLMLCCKSF